MATKKLYLANLKPHEQFGDGILKGALCLDEILPLLQSKEVEELTYEYEGKTYLNIQVVKRKEAKFEKTHYVEIPTFVPQKSTPANDSTAKAEPKKTTTAKKKNTSAKK